MEQYIQRNSILSVHDQLVPHPHHSSRGLKWHSSFCIATGGPQPAWNGCAFSLNNACLWLRFLSFIENKDFPWKFSTTSLTSPGLMLQWICSLQRTTASILCNFLLCHAFAYPSAAAFFSLLSRDNTLVKLHEREQAYLALQNHTKGYQLVNQKNVYSACLHLLARAWQMFALRPPAKDR